MKRSQPTNLGLLLKELLSDKQTFSKGLMEGRIVNSWRDVVGPYIANATSKFTLRDGVVYVSLSSAAAAAELFARRMQIMASLNSIAGQKLVRFIHISLG